MILSVSDFELLCIALVVFHLMHLEISTYPETVGCLLCKTEALKLRKDVTDSQLLLLQTALA